MTLLQAPNSSSSAIADSLVVHGSPLQSPFFDGGIDSREPRQFGRRATAERALSRYLYDIHPTLCEITGLKVPEKVEFKSLKPAIINAAAEHRQHLYFAFVSWQRAIRDGDHKLTEYCVNDARHTQLFNLKEDPEEIKNLADDAAQRQTLDTLRTLLKKERLRLNDGNTPFPFADKLGKDFWPAYESATH